ncbi:unnamed protein product [Sphenostylis stenocarpa]|uniref:Uncharacterized protein n=1 Tax=Sphenostylis stenocarpa TaxID=92480 RepID=A0AA86SWL3_9FABA|nr:unnamed protein product [Sphenostylis stenocarpa]
MSTAKETHAKPDSLIATTVVELLKRAWRNEKAAPEILRFESHLIPRSRVGSWKEQGPELQQKKSKEGFGFSEVEPLLKCGKAMENMNRAFEKVKIMVGMDVENEDQQAAALNNSNSFAFMDDFNRDCTLSTTQICLIRKRLRSLSMEGTRWLLLLDSSREKCRDNWI